MIGLGTLPSLYYAGSGRRAKSQARRVWPIPDPTMIGFDGVPNPGRAEGGQCQTRP